MKRPIAIIESPFAGDVERNLAYARAAMADCINRGETPLASHLLYTQAGVLRDDLARERALGIDMGFQFWEYAERICFYVDLGWSRGMNAAKDRFLRGLEEDGVLEMEERSIPGWINAWNSRKPCPDCGLLLYPGYRCVHPAQLGKPYLMPFLPDGST